MPNLWHSAVSPLPLSVSGEWAVALFSLSLDSRGPSRPASPFTHSWPFHTQTFFYFLFLICAAHITPGGRIGYCCVSSPAAGQQRVIMSAKMGPREDRVGTTAEMSQIHSYRQWEQEDGWWGRQGGEGVEIRLCRVRSGDKEMNALLYFRWLSVGGLQSRGNQIMVKIDQAGMSDLKFVHRIKQMCS